MNQDLIRGLLTVLCAAVWVLSSWSHTAAEEVSTPSNFLATANPALFQGDVSPGTSFNKGSDEARASKLVNLVSNSFSKISLKL